MDTKLVLRLMETARSVTPLVAVTASSFDLPQEPSAGDAVRAQVATRLADGNFRVIIDGKAFKLALPADVRPGDILQLRVAPRSAERPRASESAPQPSGGTLSSAGRALANVLSQPPADPPHQTKPVLHDPPTRPDDLPEPLARAVERSGVFYESHQARWVEGEYPLQRLLEEPQAAIGGHEAVAVTEEVIVAAEKAVVASPPSAHAVRVDPRDAQASTPLAAQGSGTKEPEAIAARAEGIAREALPLVRQQLDTLETRQLVWVGDIWPGQPMRWEIGEQPESGGESRESAEWCSRFKLCLPSLGDVGAELVLSGARIRIRLSAREPASAAMMRAAGAELIGAFHAAGLQTVGCKVDCDDSTA